MQTGLMYEIWYFVGRGRTRRDKYNDSRVDCHQTKKLGIVRTMDEVRAMGKSLNLRHISIALLRKMSKRNKKEDLNQKGYFFYKIHVLVNPKHPKEGGIPIAIYNRFPCLQKIKLSKLRPKKK